MKTVHSRTPPEWLAAGYRNDFMRTWVSGRSFAEGCARGACRSGGWLVAGGVAVAARMDTRLCPSAKRAAMYTVPSSTSACESGTVLFGSDVGGIHCR